eukprot:SAG31_NODE_9322_length_1292_cov_1.005004_2_plen_113_part_01
MGGKRPRSSMAPMIVLERGKPLLGIGSPGGTTIIGAVANALVARLVDRLPLQSAVDLPRVISRNTGSNLVETPLCVIYPDACSGLRDAGYGVSVYAPGTLVQAAEIMRTAGIK